MVRVVAGGPELAAFPDSPYTDRYVKILFPRPGVVLPERWDVDALRGRLPRAHWPATRTYTAAPSTEPRASWRSTWSSTAGPSLPRRGPPPRDPETRCGCWVPTVLRAGPDGRVAPAGPR